MNHKTMNEYKTINFNDILSIREMYRQDIVFGAHQLRFQHLLLDKIDIKYPLEDLSPAMEILVKKHWITFIRKLELFHSQFGFCPWMIIFVDLNGKQCEVPIVPELNFVIRMRIVNFQKQYYAIDTSSPAQQENKRIHFTQSTLVDGPCWNTGEFHSEGGALLKSWKELRETKIINRQVELSSALPGTMIQRQNQGDFKHLVGLTSAALTNETTIRISSDGLLLSPNDHKGEKPSDTLEFLSKRLLEDETLIDRGSLVTRVEDGYQVAPSTHEAKVVINIFEHIRLFFKSVAHTLQIPSSYVGDDSGKGGNNTRPSTATGSVDTERLRLISHVDCIRRDVTDTLKGVWIKIYGEEDSDVQIHIPMASNISIETIEQLYERNVIPDEVAINELLHIAHIDSVQLKEYPRPKKLRKFIRDIDDDRPATHVRH